MRHYVQKGRGRNRVLKCRSAGAVAPNPRMRNFLHEVRHFAAQVAIITVLLLLFGWPIGRALAWLVKGGN